jgi:glycerol-3-phosphate acyltransferase PlsY
VVSSLVIVIAYLLGSIPFALIIARLNGVTDLRKRGSGNLGATNVWRHVGPKAAIIVLLADIGKGALAVLIAPKLLSLSGVADGSSDLLLVAVGLAAVLGHVWPIYLGFRGGKGVATAVGVMLVLLPIPTFVAIAVFAIVVGVTRYVSLGSIVGAVVLSGVVMIEKYLMAISVGDTYVYMALVLASLVLLTHRHNLVRLARGTENRFSFSSGSSREDDRG